MHLRQNRNKQSGRNYLSIVQGYRDKNGNARSKTVQTIGYLDEIQKEYEDPIKHFTEVARQLTNDYNADKSITISIDKSERLKKDGDNRKNYGHVVFSKIYHELGIHTFLNNARRHENFKYNTDSIMRLLVFSRLLYPGSKKNAIEQKGRFFDNFKFSLDDIYDALTHFNKHSEALQKHIHESIMEQYNRKTDLVYYDVTNYYFEIDKQDELRKKGYSKENRKDPIVQMGMAMDSQGIPITYRIHPGNKHDSETLLDTLAKIKNEYSTQRIVVVADKGVNTGDNIAFGLALGDGYIYSKSIMGADEDFKKYVLEQDGYSTPNGSYKQKSKITPTYIWVTVPNRKTKKKIAIDQKWIVFYSEKYAKRASYKRAELIAKAEKMIKDPSKYNKATDYGAAKYVENIEIDPETGEVTKAKGTDKLSLNIAKIRDEEKYDGYYAIATSEFDTPDEEIIDTYHGLWRIEESFKITKSLLSARPVYLSREDHINAHFLICFVALVIGRLVELRLSHKFPLARIIDSLRLVACSHIDQNHYLFDYVDSITDAANDEFDIDIGNKILSLKEIKRNLGLAKKG
jgi:transposase